MSQYGTSTCPAPTQPILALLPCHTVLHQSGRAPQLRAGWRCPGFQSQSPTAAMSPTETTAGSRTVAAAGHSGAPWAAPHPSNHRRSSPLLGGDVYGDRVHGVALAGDLAVAGALAGGSADHLVGTHAALPAHAAHRDESLACNLATAATAQLRRFLYLRYIISRILRYSPVHASSLEKQTGDLLCVTRRQVGWTDMVAMVLLSKVVRRRRRRRGWSWWWNKVRGGADRCGGAGVAQGGEGGWGGGRHLRLMDMVLRNSCWLRAPRRGFLPSFSAMGAYAACAIPRHSSPSDLCPCTAHAAEPIA